jgi:hypothetical protein
MEVHSNNAAAANITVRTPSSTGLLVPVASGEVWSVGIYGRWGSGTAKNLRCDLRWMNGATTESATQPSLGSSVAMNTTGWVQSVAEGATAPADAVGLRVRVVVVGAVLDDTFYLDGLQMEKAATLPAFDTGGGGGLGIPQNLTATTVSATQIDLDWDAVTGATGYDIERNGSVVVFDHTTNSYSDTGLASSTEYTYRVRSVG